MKASHVGDLIFIKGFIKSGLDINLQNNEGDSALIFASRFHHLDTVRELIKNGANVNLQNDFGKTALTLRSMWASHKGHLDTVKILVRKGADACAEHVNIQNNYGFTALMYASWNDHLDIVKYLIRKGANDNLKNNNGDTALTCVRNKTTKEIILREVKLRNIILKERIMNVAYHWNMNLPLELKHVIIKKFIK